MQVYSDLVVAYLESLAADPAAGATEARFYWNNVGKIVKWHNGTGWKSAVDTDTAQVLTAKDYDGGTATNTSRMTIPKATKSTLDALTRKTATLVFATDLAKLYVDNGSQLVEIGSGQGELNALKDHSTAANWAASGAGVTVTTTTSASELPLGGVIDSAIKVTPVSSTDYAYYRFTLPASLKGRKLKFEAWLRNLSSYATGDLKVDVYTNAASNYGGAYTRIALTTDVSAVSGLPAVAGKYATYFDTTTTADYYEVRIGRVAGTSALSLAGVIVGPGIQPTGAAIGPWVSFTPAWDKGGGGASPSYSSNVGRCRRVGDSVEIQVSTTFSAWTTGAASTLLSLPTVLGAITIDATNWQQGGVAGSFYDTSATKRFSVWAYNSSNLLRFDYYDNTGATGNIAAILANGDSVDIHVTVPVAEWGGSGGVVNVAQNDVEFSYNTDVTSTSSVTASGFGYGTLGGAFGAAWSVGTNYTRRVQFLTPIQANDRLELEFSQNSGVTWVPFGSDNSATSLTYQNGVIYGANVAPVSATAADVVFRTGGRVPNGATYGANGSDWSGLNGGVYRWRVRKINGGQAVGFSEYVPGAASGLVSGLYGLKGFADNSAPTAGYLGEKKTSQVTAGSPITGHTTNSPKTVTSITLTAGCWDIKGAINFDGATTVTQYRAMISAATNSTPSNANSWGTPNASYEFTNIKIGTAFSTDTLVIPPYEVLVAAGATLTLYLVAYCTYGGGTLATGGFIEARRVR